MMVLGSGALAMACGAKACDGIPEEAKPAAAMVLEAIPFEAAEAAA